MAPDIMAAGLYVPTPHVVLAAVNDWCFNMEIAPRSRRVPADEFYPDARALVELFCPGDATGAHFTAGCICIGHWDDGAINLREPGALGEWVEVRDGMTVYPVAWRYLRHAPVWDFAACRKAGRP